MRPTEIATLHRIDIDGHALECQFIRTDNHAAPTLVFLHEGLGSLALWKDFPAQMASAAKCHALVYSRYGYGNSAPLTESRTIGFMHHEALQVLPELLKRLEIDNPILFGHSDGASIALIYAASTQLPLPGMILLAPHVMIEDMCITSIEGAKQVYETTEMREKLRRYHADPDGAFWGWCNIWLDPGFRAWNIEAEVSKVICPLLVIQGFDDQYGTMEQIDRIARLTGDTTLLKLHNCGHSPHRDQPQAVIDAAVKFLGRIQS